MNHEHRAALIANYREGPAILEEALAEAPEPSRQWQPGPGEWTVHEIVCHCADAEAIGYARIRMLAAAPSPLIAAYDQEQWTRSLAYHEMPLESALMVIRSVRAHTLHLLDIAPESLWTAHGQHSESGNYTTDDWLQTYSRHLHDHAAQIRDNVQRWRAR